VLTRDFTYVLAFSYSKIAIPALELDIKPSEESISNSFENFFLFKLFWSADTWFFVIGLDSQKMSFGLSSAAYKSSSSSSSTWL